MVSPPVLKRIGPDSSGDQENVEDFEGSNRVNGLQEVQLFEGSSRPCEPVSMSTLLVLNQEPALGL